MVTYSLDNYILDSIPNSESEFLVSFYADINGWKWSSFRRLVSEFICDRIARIRAPSPGQNDFRNWKPEANPLEQVL